MRAHEKMLGERWSTQYTHCVRKAEFLLLGPKGRVGAVETKAKHTAISTWLSRAFCYCRGPRKHDDDTGDVARGQHWSTPCMHCVRKAEFLLLGPKGRVGAVETKAKHTQFALGSLGPFVTAGASKT